MLLMYIVSQLQKRQSDVFSPSPSLLNHSLSESGKVSMSSLNVYEEGFNQSGKILPLQDETIIMPADGIITIIRLLSTHF